MMMFNTSSGNDVVFGIPGEVKKALAKKTMPERFNALLGLTYALKDIDFWMNDNEFWEEGDQLEQSIACLAKAWKKILAFSNEELNLDGEYSRPGVEALLEQFKEADDLEGGDYPFEWRR